LLHNTHSILYTDIDRKYTLYTLPIFDTTPQEHCSPIAYFRPDSYKLFIGSITQLSQSEHHFHHSLKVPKSRFADNYTKSIALNFNKTTRD
jgi:hypothetical protein